MSECEKNKDKLLKIKAALASFDDADKHVLTEDRYRDTPAFHVVTGWTSRAAVIRRIMDSDN